MGFLHPDHESLRQLAVGEIRPDTRRFVERHLTGCARCRKSVQRLIPSVPPPPEHPNLLARHAARLDEERRVAPVLEEVLRWHPPEHQKHLIRTQERFQSWALCERLIDASYQAGFEGGTKSLELARVATLVAEVTRPTRYPARLRADLQARAWAQRLNATRISRDYQKARKALGVARALGRLGSGDPLLETKLLDFERALCGQSLQFGNAVRLAERGIALARRIGTTQQEAVSWFNKASAQLDLKAVDQARFSFLRALRLVDLSVNHHLRLRFAQFRARLLACMGNPGEAQRHLRWIARSDQHLWTTREHDFWRVTETEVMMTSGRHENAEPALREMHERFLTAGELQIASFIALDLVAVYLFTGQFGLARRFGSRARLFLDYTEEPSPLDTQPTYIQHCRRQFPAFDRIVLG